ncbi:MAG: ATP-binding protein [Deltaproteobacteria bacterium]|nr:ATP-binding protein [Kofleriaceae bacterium]
MTNGKRTGGGSATTAGALYQSAASAWYCLGILAEQDFPPPLDLPADATLTFIRCETDEPVDDILAMTSHGGLIFAQAKHTLSLESGSKSDIASALDQCVRQYLGNRSNAKPRRPWNRPLVAATDRLVIVVGAQSSGPIKNDLPELFQNIRALAGRPLDDAAHNDDQRRALTVVREHCSEAWRKAAGSGPTDADLIEMLCLLRLQVLDVDADGADERLAKTILRTSILRDPTSDSSSWSLLGRFCEDLAAHRRGADRHLVQRFLLGEKVDLEAPRSYRADIERLREHSKTSLALLRDLATLRTGEQRFSIERRCTSSAVDAALGGSLLITGDPGSGKSGLLYWIADECRQKGVDCVVLLVDRIASASLGELRRDLGLEHDINDVLQNWTSLSPGVLLVDALDAAREDRAAKTIRDLIRLTLEVRERWNVVATIRKFDLRYSEELKELFRGSPPSSSKYADKEFKAVRHLNVPILDDEELADIARNAPTLGALLSEASQPLKELLRNAFNIRLAADLVTSTLTRSEFSAIESPLELLDRYWRYRILGTGGDEREHLLRSASEAMVQQRSLRVDRQSLAIPTGTALETLLSANVLVEWQKSEGVLPNRYILSYSHHVLHDYAIARLMLRGDRSSLLARLTENVDFALVARPSLSMHFHHLWADDPDEFWRLSFDVLKLEGASKVLQLIGSSVAADSYRASEELEPLFESLTSQDPRSASLFLSHLVGAIITFGLPLVGDDARPWWPFLLRLSGSLDRAIAFSVQGLLVMGVERSRAATPTQLESLGKVARALLRFGWAQTPELGSMVWAGVQGVSRALSVVPAGAEDLRRIIEPERIRSVGHIELPWLANEIVYVIDADPDLAVDIYCAAFGYEESSQATTQMSTSRILSLTSNKRQDYEMALWSLGENFGHFLEKASLQATTALASVLTSYVGRRHRFREQRQPAGPTFEFRGRTVELREDGSGIWDSGGVYSHDEGVKMLDAFAKFVLARSREGAREELEAIVDRLLDCPTSAVMWRRLLLIASQDGGNSLTEVIAPLLLNSRLLLAPDIGYAAGEFLRSRAGSLHEELRQRIEQALLASVNAIENREYAEYRLAKLVGCLPIDAIVSDDVRQLSTRLRAEGKLPENKPPAHEVWTEEYTEEAHLRELGVEPDAPGVRSLVEQYAPLREFSSKFLNEHPSDEEIRAIYPSITKVHDAVTGRERTPDSEDLLDLAWGYLAAACTAVVGAKSFSCASDVGRTVSMVLLEAAKNRQPTYSESAEAQFNQHPSWGSPAARIDAAAGLALLGQHRDCTSNEVRDVVRKLSRDPVAAVRFQIARRLLAFYANDSTFFWELTRAFVAEESNRGVISGVVHTIAEIAPNHLDDAVGLLLSIRSRIAPTSVDESEVRRSIDSRIAQAYVYRDHKPSEQHLRALLTTVRENASALAGTLHFLRGALTYRKDNEDDAVVRHRTFALFLDMLRGAQSALDDLGTGHGQAPFSAWPEGDQRNAKELADLVRGISDQVYFASGAFDEKRKRTTIDDDAKSRGTRFYQEASALLDALATVKIAAASHHLIETLEFFVAEDPQGVFLRIAKSVKSATEDGYQHEGLGAQQVVAIVERYIAEYRSLFREEIFRRALLDMLDIFVEAGWPSARKLVYKLDEIYR